MKTLLKDIAGKFGYSIRKKSAWDDLHDFVPEAGGFEQEIMATAMQYSMGNQARMWSLIQSIRHIHRNNIAGDIVECGVWKGGHIILAALMCDQLKLDRTLWAYDTYAGMSAPVEADIDAIENKAATHKWNNKNQGAVNAWCYSSFEEVRSNFQRELPDISRIKMIKGMIEDTLEHPENIPDKISVLRLDTDFYESTKKELEVLYPRLQSGGVLIIDDYGHWQGARKAVDEYFNGRHIWLHRIDYTARLMIKP